MAKYGIADYGVLTWYGGFYDSADRVAIAKKAGFDGVERLYPHSADDLLAKAADLKKQGMGFASCEDKGNIEYSIKWTAALGGEYIWADVQKKTFPDYFRQIQELSLVCKRYGIKAAVHNHMGSVIETQEQVEMLMRECPDVYLLLDTGHLAVAGGDVKYIAQTYYDRIAAYHLKNWQTSDTPDHEQWNRRGRFCGLFEGNFFIDNEWVFKNALKNGFQGWFHVEHDKHLREPVLDLAESFKVLKKWESEV